MRNTYQCPVTPVIDKGLVDPERSEAWHSKLHLLAARGDE